MSEEAKFTVFCMESYKAHKSLSGRQVYDISDVKSGNMQQAAELHGQSKSPAIRMNYTDPTGKQAVGFSIDNKMYKDAAGSMTPSPGRTIRVIYPAKSSLQTSLPRKGFTTAAIPTVPRSLRPQHTASVRTKTSRNGCGALQSWTSRSHKRA